MQTSEENKQNPNNPSEQRSFAPFVAHSLKVEGNDGFGYNSVLYNEKHDLIIDAPIDDSLRFYDATTLLPLEGFDTEKLDGVVTGMSFCPETETFIFGCGSGNIYIYNLSKKTLKKLEQPIEADAVGVSGVVFINSSHYAFSGFKSCEIYVGNFEDADQYHSFLQKGNIHDLKSLPKRNLLFSRLSDGSIMIYGTCRLPKLPLLDSIQGGRCDSSSIQNITINGKDYILSNRNDTIEIWHLIKGKMRRLKVIRAPELLSISNMLYLENYKMVVTTHHTRKIRFWRFYSGKLEWKLDVGMNKCYHSFVMEDKNALGVVDFRLNTIKIVQLHPSPQEST